MARRRSKARKKRQGPGHNEQNRRTKESRDRSKMLDSGREPYFRYDVEELLADKGKEPEEVRPFLQAIWTQGSRNDIEAALEFAKEKEDEGFLDPDTRQKIEIYVKKYSTWR